MTEQNHENLPPEAGVVGWRPNRPEPSAERADKDRNATDLPPEAGVVGWRPVRD